MSTGLFKESCLGHCMVLALGRVALVSSCTFSISSHFCPTSLFYFCNQGLEILFCRVVFHVSARFMTSHLSCVRQVGLNRQGVWRWTSGCVCAVERSDHAVCLASGVAGALFCPDNGKKAKEEKGGKEEVGKTGEHRQVNKSQDRLKSRFEGYGYQ